MRIAIGLSYDGSRFEGWQSQPSGNTVQDHLERALAAVADAPVRVTAAGRTDAGVHAAAQVVHFDCDAQREESAWIRGTNAHMPQEIAVQWAVPVSEEFNARFSAVARSYRYVLYNHPVRPAISSRHAGWYHRPLDIARMKEGAALLLGVHDFSAFRSSECQAKTPVRSMESVSIRANGPHVLFDFTANAFLHHMIRNLVGSLVYVGKGKHPPSWMGELLDERDRRLAAPTISAAGLYLTAVRYEPRWSLPEFARMMPFDYGLDDAGAPS
jgi:tRNA pseudouridine38-40 synthase